MEFCAQHKIDPILRQLAVLRAFEDADELDLSEAAPRVDDGGCGSFVEWRFSKVDLDRRAAGVADNDGPLTLAARAVGELTPIGVFPSLDG